MTTYDSSFDPKTLDARVLREVDQQPHRLVFVTISGAHLYGFPSPDSDFDLRGVHLLPAEQVLGLDVRDETLEVSEDRAGLEIDLVTHDLRLAWRAWERLAVGTVLIGEVPTWRADELPYGGVKDSGSGREGVAAAIRSFTEERVLVLRAG